MHPAVQQFWEEYNYPSVCGFAFEYGNNHPRLHGGAACHAALAHAPRKDLTAYSSSLLTEGDRTEAQQIWDYLLDPKESPYRGVLANGVQIIRHKDGYPIAFRLPSLEDLHARAVGGLSIAVRIPTEHEHTNKMFCELLKHGFTNHEAFYVSLYIGLGGEKNVFRYNNQGHHFPVNNTENISFRRIKDGNPTYDRPSWYSHISPGHGMMLSGATYYGCDTMFCGGKIGPAEFDTYVIGEYKGIFGKVRLGKAGNASGSLQTTIEILRKVKDTWYAE